jgi:hypothetical protein
MSSVIPRNPIESSLLSTGLDEQGGVFVSPGFVEHGDVPGSFAMAETASINAKPKASDSLLMVVISFLLG